VKINIIQERRWSKKSGGDGQLWSDGTAATSPAEIIRARREAKGLTQADLAAKLEVSPPRVSEWEHGKRNPSGGTAMALRRVLGGKAEDYLQKTRINRR
jgi:ribosome-binding protein aMBF1 (putative translation factor)